MYPVLTDEVCVIHSLFMFLSAVNSYHIVNEYSSKSCYY